MAHCTGCGLWLRESELFCGICGLKRAVGEPRDRPEPALARAACSTSDRRTQRGGNGHRRRVDPHSGTRLERQDARPGLAPCTRLRRAGRALGASRVCARGNAGRRNGLRRRGTGHLGHRSGDPRSLRVDGESGLHVTLAVCAGRPARLCFNSRPNNSAKRHNRYQSRSTRSLDLNDDRNPSCTGEAAWNAWLDRCGVSDG